MTQTTDRKSTARPRQLAVAFLATLLAMLWASTANAQQFGLSEFSGELVDNGGNPALQAGGHPAAMRTNMVFNTQPNQHGGQTTVGDVKDAIVDLPPGFVVDPSKVPTCPATSFLPPGVTGFTAKCAHETQIGEIVFTAAGSQGDPFSTSSVPIYNLVPSRNEPASIGFNFVGTAVTAKISVRPGDYGIRAHFRNTPQLFGGFRQLNVTLWGVPADPVNDVARGRACAVYPLACFYPNGGAAPAGNPSASLPEPLITNATNCSAGPLTTRVTANAWHDPEGTEVVASFDHDVNDNPMAVPAARTSPSAPTSTSRWPRAGPTPRPSSTPA